MERMILGVLKVLDWFTGNQGDPVLVDLRRASRNATICALALVTCLGLAFWLAPGGIESVTSSAQLVEQVRHVLGTAFAVAAAIALIGTAWFSVEGILIYARNTRHGD